jgi:hypothetical protein
MTMAQDVLPDEGAAAADGAAAGESPFTLGELMVLAACRESFGQDASRLHQRIAQACTVPAGATIH